jgi:hypothetical protein
LLPIVVKRASFKRALIHRLDMSRDGLPAAIQNTACICPKYTPHRKPPPVPRITPPHIGFYAVILNEAK